MRDSALGQGVEGVGILDSALYRLNTTSRSPYNCEEIKISEEILERHQARDFRPVLTKIV